MFERATGQAIGDPFPSLAQYSALSVSPDGKTLMTGDGTQIYDGTSTGPRGERLPAGRGTKPQPGRMGAVPPNGGPYRGDLPEYPG